MSFLINCKQYILEAGISWRLVLCSRGPTLGSGWVSASSMNAENLVSPVHSCSVWFYLDGLYAFAVFFLGTS